MSEGDDYQKRPVTNAQLMEELKKFPTRWEMRFLILAAIIANQFIPAADIAKATLDDVVQVAFGTLL